MKNKTALSFFIILCLVLFVKGDNIWQYCPGTVNPTFKINSLTVEPSPPKIGKSCIVQLDGSLEQDVTSGSSTFQIEYFVAGNWRPLPTFHNDVCSIISCPVKAGPFQFNHTINVPIITPKGQYKGQIQLVDQSNRNITCLTFNTTLNY
ncbi:hypothetical protein DICPUDRAFT_51005 [Dictyostelium purpureum]|uniref:MD-2-related lipid-recognition domain-containing protein n=1 Tax=Dictyostelium purpureum TaxID=5786 RepID=F1A1H6_DICPU|nr:uncharacterized protein DICPUDRAFT_51005 [Dictyostelium purpureum]EGC29956.1 hypothetical protein DICPUDRAFT_51005 [Dictyostelium purpureum]|eukprot:XP_003293516.1 hypothetical protein DICPUDRAFT_51005 [Dictyostelium purpureum]